MKSSYPRFSPFGTYSVSSCPAAGLYDLLSFFPFSFKNNQSGQGGERKSKQQIIHLKS